MFFCVKHKTRRKFRTQIATKKTAKQRHLVACYYNRIASYLQLTWVYVGIILELTWSYRRKNLLRTYFKLAKHLS